PRPRAPMIRVLELGPEAGAGGGRVIALGTPEEVAATPDSHTGRFLAEKLRATARPAGKAPARRVTATGRRSAARRSNAGGA
ncbi:MAG: hypothetical protein KDE27_09500, partial [Planctomycetes bacterium]|nr:hypothetical protein [Planctomycetota bacterium]